ncbi:NAD(+) diphosphatase [Psychrobacter sp. JB385]|uniref:NAD(+) diphosphatase n=1 Tax=Psychrobacter sp. JB385 TaxID=1434841 RepID=UPI00097F5A6A|nr:NAD(+) diphosphatase [Psychrobacter sp. JB385]SJN19834.1 NADH pyrophosphatase [Psychrobacter sp. JB385]
MTHAFVFRDDTLLCRQTSDGWWPLQVQLPQSTPQSEDGERSPTYQVGRVALLESLAPSHWLSDSLPKSSVESGHQAIETDSVDTFTAQSTNAVTDTYALAHNMVLPAITDHSGYDFLPYRQLITQLPIALSTQISQAIQLLRWQQDTQFCSRCATPAVHTKTDERAMVCPVCQLRQYPRVQPCVITAITRPNPTTGEMQILLAQHRRHGVQKQPAMYGLIAGFVEVGESLEHAVVREVAEEVNISVTDIRYVSSQPWPFPSNLMLGFRATYAEGDIVIQEEELTHADFFDISNLPQIPFKGSIAYELIALVAHEQGLSL